MDELDFGFDKPNFQTQFGGKTGTVSEKRAEQASAKDGGGVDAAGIIDASAGGLDSITNMVSMFTGKPSAPTTETNETATPTEKKKVNPFVWIGGGLVVLLFIALLISSKNGPATIPEV